MTTRKLSRTESGNRAADYLKAPYARVLLPDRDGGYSAEILEFPGCIAEGDTAEEALRNLESAAESWITAALEQGQQIPEPMEVGGFSGRVALRLPRSLHRQATRIAQRDGTSLNQLVVSAVAARIGIEDIVDRVAQRWTDSRVSVIQTQPVQNLTFVATTNNFVFPQQGAIQVGSLGTFGAFGSTGTFEMNVGSPTPLVRLARG